MLRTRGRAGKGDKSIGSCLEEDVEEYLGHLVEWFDDKGWSGTLDNYINGHVDLRVGKEGIEVWSGLASCGNINWMITSQMPVNRTGRLVAFAGGYGI